MRSYDCHVETTISFARSHYELGWSQMTSSELNRTHVELESEFLEYAEPLRSEMVPETHSK